MAVPRSTPAWNFFCIRPHFETVSGGMAEYSHLEGYPLLPHNIALRKNLCNFAVGYIE